MFKRTMAVIFAALMLAAALTGCTRAQRTQYFAAGVELGNEPLVFATSDDVLTGFEVELAYLIADRMELPPLICPIDPALASDELKGGTVSCIWCATENGSVKDAIYTDAYIEDWTTLLVMKSDDAVDYAGKALGYVGTEAPVMDVIGEAKEYATMDDAIAALKAGEIYAVYGSRLELLYKAKDDAALFVAQEQEFGERKQYCIAFSSENAELKNSVQSALNDLIAGGTAKNPYGEDTSALGVSEKWFGESVFMK